MPDEPKNKEVNININKKDANDDPKMIDLCSDNMTDDDNSINIDLEDLESESRISISADTINRLELSVTDLNIAEQVISVGSCRNSTNSFSNLTNAGSRHVMIQRSPRIHPPPVKKEIEIPRPPSPPTEPGNGGITDYLMPIGMILITIVIFVIMSSMSDGSGHFIYMLAFMVPINVLTLIITLNRNSAQKKKYLKTEKIRREKYTQALNAIWSELTCISEEVQDALLETDPDLKECERRVGLRDRRLWERRPADDDFLQLRLGLGSIPFPVQVRYPPQEITIHDDPLYAEAYQGKERFSCIEGVPVCLPLFKGGTAGIIGNRQSVLHTTRAILTQMAVHHSYDEVKIIAVYDTNESREWDWLKALPHTRDNRGNQQYIARNPGQAKELLSSFNELIKKREVVAEVAGQTQPRKHLPHLVFLIVDQALIENEQIMRYLLNNKPELGYSSLFLFDRIENLPGNCNYIVNVDTTRAQLVSRLDSTESTYFASDSMPIRQAEELARKMAPLRLQELFPSDDLPEQVSLLDLLGVNRVEELNIHNRWQNSKAYKSLSALLGLKAGNEKLSLDIHDKNHGPHGLVAGTTGSGKSELLQTLILSIAINYHPHDVMFVLIDYKGGGMANVFKGLPHLAGIITNLAGNQTTRALLSIKSELHRRQNLFDQSGVNHIDRYIRLTKQGRTEQAIPHLVIIVDEFAELKSEQPDFMRELVSTARVGRSLGVHLILATQKPAGVVDDQIWSNARFKICLKVQNTEDSQEMLKRPDASMITLPGRAYMQVGNNEIFEFFQSAYSGTGYYYSARSNRNAGEVLIVNLGDTIDFNTLYPQTEQRDDLQTQLQALVDCMADTAYVFDIEPLKGQWLPPLPEEIALKGLDLDFRWEGSGWKTRTNWLTPVVGIIDNPAAQKQYPLKLDLGREGHIAIYGAPGSGKTTFVQTIITALALDHTPEELNLYILDYGGRTLSVFASLPHVGSVLTVDDEDKLKKLMRMLLKELDKRKRLFAEKSVGTLKAYHEAGGDNLPAIVVVVDNYPALFELYPESEDFFVQVSREGGNLGLYLVLAAGGVTSIQYKIASSIKQAVALQFADKGDYSSIVGRTGGLEPESFNGRGLIKGSPPLEFQTALAVEGETEADRATALSWLVQKMDKNWQGKRAKPVPVLPEVLKQKDLYSDERVIESSIANPFNIAIGLDMVEFEPVNVNILDSPCFLVTGKLKCGKTVFLKSMISAMSERFTPNEIQVFIIDSHAMGLIDFKNKPYVGGYAGNQPQLNDLIDRLWEMIEKQRTAITKARTERDNTAIDNETDILSTYQRIALIIDDFNDFMQMADSAIKDKLEKIIVRERGLKIHIFTAAMINDIGGNWEPLAKAIKDCQTGLLMADALEQQVFNIRISYSEGAIPLKIGEGYLVNRGQYTKIKVAMV